MDAFIQPMYDNRSPSVMVWGTIHHGARSELVVLDGIQYASLVTCVDKIYVCVQNNAMSHKAREMAACLAQHNVDVIDWLARSRDIEHIWDQMGV